MRCLPSLSFGILTLSNGPAYKSKKKNLTFNISQSPTITENFHQHQRTWTNNSYKISSVTFSDKLPHQTVLLSSSILKLCRETRLWMLLGMWSLLGRRPTSHFENLINSVQKGNISDTLYLPMRVKLNTYFEFKRVLKQKLLLGRLYTASSMHQSVALIINKPITTDEETSNTVLHPRSSGQQRNWNSALETLLKN